MTNKPLLPPLAAEEKEMLLKAWEVPKDVSEVGFYRMRQKFGALQKAIDELKNGTPANLTFDDTVAFMHLLEAQSRVLKEVENPTVRVLNKVINHIDPEVEIQPEQPRTR